MVLAVKITEENISLFGFMSHFCARSVLGHSTIPLSLSTLIVSTRELRSCSVVFSLISHGLDTDDDVTSFTGIKSLSKDN